MFFQQGSVSLPCWSRLKHLWVDAKIFFTDVDAAKRVSPKDFWILPTFPLMPQLTFVVLSEMPQQPLEKLS